VPARASAIDQFKLAIIRPIKLLLLVPIVTLNSLYVAITYGILYLLFTTFSFVYQEQYGFDEGTSGLTFLPAGLGMMAGVVGFGQLTDARVKRNNAAGIVHKPEYRMAPILTIPSGLALPVGLFIYGWTTQKGVHWIVPMLGVVIFAAGLMGIMVSRISHVSCGPDRVTNECMCFHRCQCRIIFWMHTQPKPRRSLQP
jgi:hypothetical protein